MGFAAKSATFVPLGLDALRQGHGPPSWGRENGDAAQRVAVLRQCYIHNSAYADVVAHPAELRDDS